MSSLLNVRSSLAALSVIAALGTLLFEAAQRNAPDEHLIRQQLDQEWSVLKAYVRVDHYRPRWEFDRSDPNQAKAVERIQNGVLLFTDARNTVLFRSHAAQGVSLPSPPAQQWLHASADPAGNTYTIIIGKPLTNPEPGA